MSSLYVRGFTTNDSQEYCRKNMNNELIHFAYKELTKFEKNLLFTRLFKRGMQ